MPFSPLVHLPLRASLGPRHSTHPCPARDYMGPSSPSTTAPGLRKGGGGTREVGGRRAHCPSCTPGLHAEGVLPLLRASRRGGILAAPLMGARSPPLPPSLSARGGGAQRGCAGPHSRVPSPSPPAWPATRNPSAQMVALWRRPPPSPPIRAGAPQEACTPPPPCHGRSVMHLFIFRSRYH